MTVNHIEIRYFEFVFLIGIYFLRSFPCLVLILYLSAEFERLCVHVLLISPPPESGLLLAQTVTASNVVRSGKMIVARSPTFMALVLITRRLSADWINYAERKITHNVHGCFLLVIIPNEGMNW